mmetsp:Transcript_11851/g.28319  ORF Transcript_11851/g.28319 Transcript_11851/m.28319 type:complete len:481 (+) Transcript_11851:221-1663(+)
MDFFSGLDTFGKETSILNRFLFPAPKSSYTWTSFPGELICIVGREGNIVPCTLMPGMSCPNSEAAEMDEPASCLLIYCHANGEDIGILYEAGHWLCDTLGVHVLIPEYPGYGCAPGSPNELSVNRNVETAYDFAVNAMHWDPARIILFGRSIGTGPAIKLASENEVGGLVLVSPYTSVKDMVRTHAGIVTSWLTAELTNMFPNIDMMPAVACPSLIVHGAKDKVIPSEQALRLHAASSVAAKRLIILEGIGHHGIDLHFAVAHELPQLFNLSGYPKVLNLDQFLCDPSLQGDTVASPVPAFDCRHMSWSRPVSYQLKQPHLRSSDDAAESENTRANGGGDAEAGVWDENRIVTDDVLLARISRQGFENADLREHEAFASIRKTHRSGTAPAHPPNASRAPPGEGGRVQRGLGFFETYDVGADGMEEQVGVLWRTDGRGRVVEVPSGVPLGGSIVPPKGPDTKWSIDNGGTDTHDPKLFVY